MPFILFDKGFPFTNVFVFMNISTEVNIIQDRIYSFGGPGTSKCGGRYQQQQI